MDKNILCVYIFVLENVNYIDNDILVEIKNNVKMKLFKDNVEICTEEENKQKCVNEEINLLDEEVFVEIVCNNVYNFFLFNVRIKKYLC